MLLGPAEAPDKYSQGRRCSQGSPGCDVRAKWWLHPNRQERTEENSGVGKIKQAGWPIYPRNFPTISLQFSLSSSPTDLLLIPTFWQLPPSAWDAFLQDVPLVPALTSF